jgi:hypothetical protein
LKIGKFPIFVCIFGGMEFREMIEPYAEEPLTRQLMLDVLKDYQRPNDKINELVRKGELTAVKNGLYIPGPNISVPKPEPFLIANYLRGPSYVSMEAALYFWGIIPERVYEVSSVTVKASRTYRTPVGRYSYTHIPSPYYCFGINSVPLTARQVVLMASAEKAVCDKIVTTSGVLLRSQKQTTDFLFSDMRMDEELLRTLDWRQMETWVDDAPKRSSIQMLVKTLSQL